MMREIEQFYSTQIEEMPMFVLSKSHSRLIANQGITGTLLTSSKLAIPMLFHSASECRELDNIKVSFLSSIVEWLLGIFFAWLTEKSEGYEGGHIGFIKEVPKKKLTTFCVRSFFDL
jgi:hypothetical protein